MLMRHVEIEAAQRIFEELLDEVEHGATIMLTRDGVAVARMIPYETESPRKYDSPQRT
jgi:prevent-host-death family protein